MGVIFHACHDLACPLGVSLSLKHPLYIDEVLGLDQALRSAILGCIVWCAYSSRINKQTHLDLWLFFPGFFHWQQEWDPGRRRKLVMQAKYSLLRSLVSPESPGEKDFACLVKKLKDHFNPVGLCEGSSSMPPWKHIFSNGKLSWPFGDQV